MMCCYYPTTTVAIDDDIDFLGILTKHMGIAKCIPYSHPDEAVNKLQNQKPFERILNRVIKSTHQSENSETSSDNHAILFNMRGLHEEIYNKNRYNDVSVMIIDYYMDTMSGIEVCEALKDHPAKKILLTGGADKERIAIDAFNNGIIHRFINKKDADFPNRLKQAVSTLKEEYFLDLNSILLPHVNTMPRNQYQYPQFINFMRNMLDQFEAVEHYMVDTIGTSIMLNAQGEPTWLVLKHESEMEAYTQIARDLEASQHLLDKLANRSHIPFFFTEKDYQQPTSEWEGLLYSAQSLPGLKTYYAICKNEQQYIDTNRIFSYNQLMNQ